MSAGWLSIPLGDVLTMRSHSQGVDPSMSYPNVGIYSFGRGLFEKLPVNGNTSSAKTLYRIEAGQFIYSRLFAFEGAYGIVPQEFDGYFVSNEFPMFDCKPNEVCPAYLSWLFRRPHVWDEIAARAKGVGDRRRRIHPEALLGYEIPLPPIGEQRRIVARIEALAAEIDHARTLRQQAADETEALFTSTLRRLTGALEAQGCLRDVLVAEPRNGWSAKCDNADGGTAVLSLSAVTGFKYRSHEYKRTSLYASENGHFWLKPGDLLITRSNTPELVGHAAIYDGSPEPCIYPDLMMRLDVKPESALKEFVLYWLMSPRIRAYITGAAKGTSPTMKKISQGIVSNTPFPTNLSIENQRRIVAELDKLQAEVDRLKALQAETAAEIDALLPAILDRAFKGELLQ